MGIKRSEYEDSIRRRSKEEGLELMKSLQLLITRDNSALAWVKRKNALCFVRFLVDRIPTPELQKCKKAIRQELIVK